MKIAHEAPKSIFNFIQSRTDYDYALVHLFEEDPEYLEQFKKAKEAGREIILDNSVFELGTAFDPIRFVYWINELNPTYYIVPDVLDDCEKTKKNMEDWIRNYKELVSPECKMIGSIQGSDYEELEDCYIFMDKYAEADKIAITFDSAAYSQMFPHKNKMVSWMMGRIAFLSRIKYSGVVNEKKPHHLLGAGLIEEFKYYGSEFNWIDSVDTSAPVVYGIKNKIYDQSCGNYEKPSEKLYTLINAELNDSQKSYIDYNIDVFRKFCNTEWYKENK